jgi:DNA-binding NarL/FixJ family response regulator
VSTSILIADDEPALRRLLTMLLERDPRLDVVGEAADGREALDRVEELDPDVLLLDVRMPNVDGLEVLDALRGRSRPRIVVLTGFADPVTHAAALELGAAACLVKGRDFAALPDVLAGAV